MVGELISKPYIDITLKLMAQFGVQVANEGYRVFKIPADAHYHAPEHLHVEGDASGASYFLAAGLIAATPVRVTGIGANSIQGDVAFARELEKNRCGRGLGRKLRRSLAPERTRRPSL